jgi:hypothetical protein
MGDGFIQAENVAMVFDKQVLRLADICWSVLKMFKTLYTRLYMSHGKL